MRTLIAALLLCVPAFAEGPVIVGSPVVRCKVGQPPWVLLTVKDADPLAAQTWHGDIGEGKVGVETKVGLAVSSAVAGSYGFRCVVQTPSEGLDPIQILDVTVLVERSDGTIPPPVPPPVVLTFTDKITLAVKSKPDQREGFGSIAKLYETVADQIKGGLLTTPDQVTSFTDSLAAVASPAWAEISNGIIKPHLVTLKLTTAAEHEPVWREIAKAVKAGLVDLPPPIVVDPPPIPTTGLHVLIVEEMDDRSKLPASQVSIFTSTELRKWLTENKAQWRMFDDDVDQTFLEKTWKDALARPRESLPWIVASNGRTGFEGKLPTSVADLIALLEKHR